MEKVVSFVFCAMLGAGTLWASDFRMDTVIAPGLTITANDSCYRISYKLPPFHEEIVETEHGYFSTIVFDDDDYFFEMEETGRPALPVKSILLQLPEGTEEVGLHVIAEPDHYDEIVLSYPYLPAQNGLETDTVFQFDNLFYQSADWCGFAVDGVELSDIFRSLGTTGIAVNFSPTTYYPSANKVAVPDEIIIEVRCTGLSALRDIYGWFDPYDFKWRPFDDDYRPLQGYNHGRLAIFTLPEYEEALDEYVEYKESNGFTVDVHVSNGYTNAAELRSSIRSLYNDKANRPRYVLIVGDVNQIPHSKGVTGNVNNPPTDLYYACLENASIAAEPNPIPEVLLGRWPARNVADIKNMTDKTIMFEKETAACRGLCKKRCSLFSGTDDKLWMRDWFFRDIRYIGKRMTDLGYNSYLYDGRSVSASAAPAIVNDVMERSNWILVYRGHGLSDGLSNPWENVFSNDGIVNISSSPVCPISFFFACNVNSNPGPYPGPYPYPDPNIYGAFGMNWVRSYSDKGGVATFASTTISYSDGNRNFSRAIFNTMKESGNNPYLGGLILDGQRRYYNAFKSAGRRRQIERYVLIGDPSLMVYGFYRNGIPYQQTPGYTDSETDDCQKEILITPTVANQYTLISVGDNFCADILVYNQSGVLVSILHNVCGETQITTSDFTEGCYLVAVSVDGRIISREKIFVKH